MTYSSIYTYRVLSSVVSSPDTLWELTSWSNYVKRFDTEAEEQPAAVLRNGLLRYQIDALSTTPSPLICHLWLISPKLNKLQSVTGYPTVAAGDVAYDVDSNANSDVMLNWQNWVVHSYKKHIVGRSISEAQARTVDRTKMGTMRWRPPKVIKNVVGTQSWRLVLPQELHWQSRVFLYLWVEVATSATPTPLQFSWNASLTALQTLAR